MHSALAYADSTAFTDADFFQDVASAALRATRDRAWTTGLMGAQGLFPLRQIMYLVVPMEAGPKARPPLKIEVTPADGGGFQVYSKVLDLSGIGDTLAGAAKDLSDTIISLWMEYSATPTEGLAPDALALLGRLRSALG
jgi:hypothetical protein